MRSLDPVPYARISTKFRRTSEVDQGGEHGLSCPHLEAGAFQSHISLMKSYPELVNQSLYLEI